MLFWFKVFSSVSRFQRFQTLGLSPVISREFHHGTRRTDGNQSLLFPWFLCSPWLEKPWDCPQLPGKNLTRASEGVTRVAIELEVHRR